MAVQFYEEDDLRRRAVQNVKVSWLAKLVMRLGLARTPRQAQLALAACLVVLLLAMYFIVVQGGKPTVNTSPVVPNDFQPGESVIRK